MVRRSVGAAPTPRHAAHRWHDACLRVGSNILLVTPRVEAPKTMFQAVTSTTVKAGARLLAAAIVVVPGLVLGLAILFAAAVRAENSDVSVRRNTERLGFTNAE